MRQDASILLIALYVCAFIVAIFYVALATFVVWRLVLTHAEARRDRQRWARINAEAKAFRTDLDETDWQAELRHYGRAV